MRDFVSASEGCKLGTSEKIAYGWERVVLPEWTV